MKTIHLKYYEVTLEDSGLTARHVGNFYSLNDANTAVEQSKKKGWYGSPKLIDKTIKIFENYLEFTRTDKDNIREAALKKLTKEEKEALGI